MISNYWFPSLPVFAQDPAAAPSGVAGIVTDAEKSVCGWFTLEGQKVENPSKGIYIRVTDGKAEKVYVR